VQLEVPVTLDKAAGIRMQEILLPLSNLRDISIKRV